MCCVSGGLSSLLVSPGQQMTTSPSASSTSSGGASTDTGSSTNPRSSSSGSEDTSISVGRGHAKDGRCCYTILAKWHLSV